MYAVARQSIFKKLLRVPEDEYEEHEKSKEYGHVVHSPEHDDKLSSQIGQKPNQLQDSQKSESSQN